jgi:hypothetical protein
MLQLRHAQPTGWARAGAFGDHLQERLLAYDNLRRLQALLDGQFGNIRRMGVDADEPERDEPQRDERYRHLP